MSAPSSFIHVYEPPATPGAPTLLLLHGTGGNERDLLPIGRALAPVAGLLSPRGHVLEHGMPRFFRRLSEGVFDLDDLQRRTEDLATFLESASAQYGFARESLIAVGYSNGANIASSLLLSYPRIVAAAVLFRGMVPFEPGPDIRVPATPVLLANATHDPIIPRPETERLAAVLARVGAMVTVRWQVAGHQLTPADIESARAWLEAVALRDAA